jgi:hypothetical protein
MKIIGHKRSWQLIGLLGADFLLFSTTKATEVPSVIIIVGFGLLTATLYWIIRGVIDLVGLYGISVTRKRQFALYSTAILGGLIALQSIGELSGRDVLVLLPLAALGYIYSAYALYNR